MSLGIPNSPAWIAAGWTMLHLLWIGAVAWIALAPLRRLLQRTSPEIRHGVAVAALLAFSVAPIALVAWLYRPVPTVARLSIPAEITARSADPLTGRYREPARPKTPSSDLPFALPDVPAPRLLDRVVGYLPGFWILGSMVTLTMVGAGLIGVEGLRRSSRPIEDRLIVDRCRAMAEQLGIARRVVVAACDRIAMPVLIGVVRPMILLPPAAMTGWDIDQLEMALLHELAHVKRFDNLVAILQRIAESLLFFHPVTWWLSGWIALERELCCDRIVIEQTGRPRDYARMLAALAGVGPSPMAMAMARRPLSTRIRRILDMEDRPMKWTLSEGLGLLAVAAAGVAFAWGARASEPARPDSKSEAFGILKRLAEDAAAMPDGPGPYEPRDYVFIRVAQSQARLGDPAAARETLRRLDGLADLPPSKAGAKVDLRAWVRLEALISSAEVRRDAGDPAGAHAALVRAGRLFDALDHGAVRRSFERVAREELEAAREELEDAESPDRPVALDEEDEIEDEIVGGTAQSLLEQYIGLGELEPARALVRRLVADIETSQEPVKSALLAAFGRYLIKAGDPAGGRTLIERARRGIATVDDPKIRSMLQTFIAGFLFESGATDKALALLPEIESGARSDAILSILGSLAAPEKGPGMPEEAGIDILIGDAWKVPKDPATTRAVAPKLAEAIRASGRPKDQARSLAVLAHLTTRAGDVGGALAIARSIPEVHRSDETGTIDGYYEAVKPITLAIIAGDRAEGGDRTGAASTLEEADAIANPIGADDQRLVAQIMIARKWVECGHPDAARAVLTRALPVALVQPEPRRSRVLSMLAEDQALAGDFAGARKTIEAIRSYPGLEKSRALSALARACEKTGDATGTTRARREAADCLVWTGPEKTLPGKVALTGRLGRYQFLDYDIELHPQFITFKRGEMRGFALANLGDVDEAVRALQSLPEPQRKMVLPQIVALLASRGHLARAMELARSVKSPDYRLNAYTQLAYVIGEGPAKR